MFLYTKTMDQILNAFFDNYTSLSKMEKNLQSTYDGVKGALNVAKEFGIPLSNNPLIKIQNHVIGLEYLLNQHILNCKVYMDLLKEDTVVDKQFVLQIQSLIYTQKEFYDKFLVLQKRLKFIKISNGYEIKIA